MSSAPPSVVPSPRRRPGGPRRWSAADKAAYLAAFAKRRLGLTAFCAETGVPRATFTLWQREARAARAAQTPQTPQTRHDRPIFARVELAPPSAPRGIALIVRGPAGLAAKLTGLDAATALTVLRLVLRPGAR